MRSSTCPAVSPDGKLCELRQDHIGPHYVVTGVGEADTWGGST